MTYIGILTYHNNTNRGAILQAYSLWNCLKNNIKKSKVEIIDYRTRQKEINRLYSRHPENFIKKLFDFRTCTKFLENQGALSPYWIITDNHQKAINFLKKKNFDMIVVGSDQVWSYRKKKNSHRPFPNAYYLDPSLDTCKVSYAASANKMSLNPLSKKEIDIYKKSISSFDKISVREKHTGDLLKKLGINEFTRVPDPTVLLDFPEKDLKDLLSSNGISLNKPILGINQLRKDIGRPIIRYFKNKGYQVVSPGKSSLADFNLASELSPFEYYSLHKYFDLVITGSFHTSIFSIKNYTPFGTLDYSKKSVTYKTETLLEEFSLQDRNIKVAEENIESILNKLEKCEKKLDKKQIQKRLSSMKQKGFSYIQELEEMLDEEDV